MPCSLLAISCSAKRRVVLWVAAFASISPPLASEMPGKTATTPSDPIRAIRIEDPITIDGDLSDPSWQGVPVVDEFFETNPSDNVPANPPAKARLAYDQRYLYVAFEFSEDDPSSIRAPMGDHDEVPSTTDYGGLILDANDDSTTAQMFLANAAGIQYDAISSDATGEDSSPDFFWESAGRITSEGWTLEMRIPFASIRYTDPNPEKWGVLLYRNRPRDFRYQYFSSHLPRERNCFICNVRPMVGLRDLPSGSHWVVAPYATGTASQRVVDGPGSPFGDTDGDLDGGVDLKWIPNPDSVVDATINPDFSQIESDTALITTNERFALFQPERRPFFLESVDLLSTPFRTSYTRTVTAPDWGARVTGGGENSRYTLLVSQDAGGGSVVLPGPYGSDLATQDWRSWVAIGRWRRDFGESFASVLYSGREIDGGGFNRVIGPDVRWSVNDHTRITAQLLFSWTETPNRPDLAEEWDGRRLGGHAFDVSWSRDDGVWDQYLEVIDVAEGFRSYNGLIPQVGYREAYFGAGRTYRPERGPVRRLRLFVQSDQTEDRQGELVYRWLGPGFGFDAFWNSFVRIELNFDEVRGIAKLHRRTGIAPTFQIQPGKVLSLIEISGRWGDQVDFAHDRLGDELDLNLIVELRPTDHLFLRGDYSRRTLDLTTDAGISGRLFAAQVARLFTRYAFNSKSWLRLIAQHVSTERDPLLWDTVVESREADFGGSLVFAYKLNWQTVLYLGLSDARSLNLRKSLEPTGREAFVKVSYAFRR